MPHITFIHGIGNKPPKDILLRDWTLALASGGLLPGAEGVTTSFVRWADVMYASPSARDQDFEAVDHDRGTEEADEETAWIDRLVDAEEAAFVRGLAERLDFGQASPDGDGFVSNTLDRLSHKALDGVDYSFEAIPVPWFIKRRFMKRFLKDVHHYLFDAESTPRPGETYRVQGHIRRLFVDQLKADADANRDGPHVVVGHSMGTVIAYDCLKHVPDCPAIDGLVTLGSPLGLSEIHTNFKPPYSKQDAFPADKLKGPWINVYDRLDPVAFDARIANDYQQNGQQVVQDIRVFNGGVWRHDSAKYLAQAKVCKALETLLEI